MSQSQVFNPTAIPSETDTPDKFPVLSTGIILSLSAGSSGRKGALTVQPYCQRGWDPRTWVPAFPMAGIWPGEPSALPLWPVDSYFFLFFLILPGVWSKSSNYDNNTLVRATQDLIYCKAMMNCWVCVATRYSYSISLYSEKKQCCCLFQAISQL